jgi:hypothetical protein
MHDETYRMLGREHEAGLEREAAKWRLAAEARGQRRDPAAAPKAHLRPRSRRFPLASLLRLIAATRAPSVK